MLEQLKLTVRGGIAHLYTEINGEISTLYRGDFRKLKRFIKENVIIK